MSRHGTSPRPFQLTCQFIPSRGAMQCSVPDVGQGCIGGNQAFGLGPLAVRSCIIRHRFPSPACPSKSLVALSLAWQRPCKDQLSIKDLVGIMRDPSLVRGIVAWSCQRRGISRACGIERALS